eukprot:TRINITY_DN35845_c0_g1_i1.p1 TRINITY_DN35845_c0_g1~~TRINITY_DN35845_c0_g1_i1.p1  ORF type:complete len:282 (+),score=35.41 TRINITY_DN35845_c0_g1_i1:34-879(+)
MSQAEQQCQDVELASSSSEISALALREVQELLAEAEEPFGPCVDSSEELGHTESKAFNFFASASSAERIAPKCHQNGNCCNRTSFSLDELRALEAAGIPSVGSILHNRACTPCEYFHRYRTWDANISRSERPPDCTFGPLCQYCHTFHPEFSAFKRRSRGRKIIRHPLLEKFIERNRMQAKPQAYPGKEDRHRMPPEEWTTYKQYEPLPLDLEIIELVLRQQECSCEQLEEIMEWTPKCLNVLSNGLSLREYAMQKPHLFIIIQLPSGDVGLQLMPPWSDF